MHFTLPEQVRVACIQMCSGSDRDANLQRAAELIATAAAKGAAVALLPENFAFMSRDDAERRQAAELLEYSAVIEFLRRQAKQHRMLLIGGSVALKSEHDKLRNASPVVAPDGELLAIYDKMHLFDVDLPGEKYTESAWVRAGDRPVWVNAGSWKIGLSVCYDLRFPELYRHYSRQGCNLLTVPAAFTVPTGRAHWQTLLQARAIENQSFLLAAAQAGEHPGGRRTWGHSMIISPWGDLLAEKAAGEGVIVADLELEMLNNIREILPALHHRRLP